MNRRPVALLLALVSVVALAGCAEIPTTGPVVAGHTFGGRAPRNYFPAEPQDGATPVEILRGFLRALPDYTDGHRVARSYLVPAVRTGWSDDTADIYPDGEPPGITQTAPISAADSRGGHGPPVTRDPTRPGSPNPRWQEGDQTTVTVQTPVIGRVDANGRLGLSAEQDRIRRVFRLVVYQGQWRISSLSNGVLISQLDFGNAFYGLPVYFPETTGQWLVPDLRWVPAPGNPVATLGSPVAAPTALVAALLKGPSAWLAPGVDSAFPAGTGLTVNGVQVHDGVARVDLTSQALNADARQRFVMMRQLDQTLGALNNFGLTVKDVEVTVEQTHFDTPHRMSSGPAVGPAPDVDSRPVAMDAAGRVARLSGRTLTPVGGVASLSGPTSSCPAVSLDGTTFAVLDHNRTRLVLALAFGAPSAVVTGRNLVPPSFDPMGWAWTAERDNKGELLAAAVGGRQRRLSVPWLAGSQVVSVRISREGARALLVTQRAGRSQAWVVPISRNPATGDVRGTPRGLGPPLELQTRLASVNGAAWLDETRVAVLGRVTEGGQGVWVLQLGGERRFTLGTSDAVAIGAGNDESELYLQYASGAVAGRAGGSWVPLPGVRWAALPG